MIAGAAVVALLAVAGGLRVAVARARAPLLPPAAERSPPVDVLLPVRDEEDNVEACLRSVLAQSAPVRVHVLDDGSTDRTAEIVRALAVGDERLTLTAVPSPPPGTNGKLNALEHGLLAATADWVLAVDADARLAPEAVARALAGAARHGLTALSLAARQDATSLGEALVTPGIFALLDILLGDWAAAAEGRGDAVANGQFFLVRRASLVAAGGYAAIRDQALDDVALARLLSTRGERVGFWRARSILRVHMYRGFRASFLGWRRNLALILGHRPALALSAALVALSPALTTALALAVGDATAAALAWAGGAAASMLLRVGSGSPWLVGLLYPLDAVALAGCLAAAVFDRWHGHIATWRGRSIPTPDDSAR